MALLKGLGLSDAIIEAKRFKRERAKLMKWGQKGKQTQAKSGI